MSEPPADVKLGYDAVMDLLPAYALGILEPDEMLAVDEYVQRHQTMLTQIEQIDRTAAHLALTTPAVTPSPGVKDALTSLVMASIAQSPTIDLQPPQSPPWNTKAIPEPSAEPPQARPAAKGGLNWSAVLISALALILILGLVGVQIGRHQRLTRIRIEMLEQTVVDVQAQTSRLETANALLAQQLGQRNSQMAQFLNAMRRVALEGTEFAPQAAGVLYAGRSSGVLILHELASLPADQTYQLWLIPSDGDPVSAGLVQQTQESVTVATILMDGQPQDFAAVGLSIEPAGGSLQPTGPIVLLGTVSS